MAFECRRWKRVAVSIAVVGLILTAGKFLMVPGIDAVEAIDACRSANSGFIGFPFYVCPAPMLPHQELLISPLLGSVAVLAFVAIWLRRRWTTEKK